MFWALLTSAMLIAIAPRMSVYALAPVALVPLLWAVRREPNVKKRALLGLAAGIPYWFVVCIWIEHVLSVHGGLDGWLAWFSFVLFSFLKAIHLAVFAAAAGYLKGRLQVPLLAALWTLIEATHGEFGFAWLTLGNAGIDTSWLLGIPAITGVYGLSFLFAMTAAAVTVAIETKNIRHLAWIACYASAFLCLPPAPAPATREAAVVQPMMPQASEWTQELLAQRLRRLVELSQQRGQAPLLIWPEMPGPIYFDGDPAFHDLAVNIATSRNRFFLFGTVTRAPNGGPLNTAIMLSPAGQELGRYHKMNLVPFGEYVPPAFSWVNRITQEAGDFVPGDHRTVFPVTDGEKAGVFICYESAFPNFVRRFADDGATFYVNISNDGYFGESKAREQHLSLVRMRAVESRRWIVRATNSGITAAVDPLGRVTQTLPEYKDVSQVVRYGVSNESTFYSRYGDWFVWVCLVALFAARWK